MNFAFLAFIIHLFTMSFWVGGMLFVSLVLIPVMFRHLEPEIRFPLWVNIFQRFFYMMAAAIFILPASGFWMVYEVYGGITQSPLYIRSMIILGMTMIGLFFLIYFLFFRDLRHNTRDKNWERCRLDINKIRNVILINQILSITILTFTGVGHYWI